MLSRGRDQLFVAVRSIIGARDCQIIICSVSFVRVNEELLGGRIAEEQRPRE